MTNKQMIMSLLSVRSKLLDMIGAKYSKIRNQKLIQKNQLSYLLKKGDEMKLELIQVEYILTNWEALTLRQICKQLKIEVDCIVFYYDVKVCDKMLVEFKKEAD